MDTKNPICTRVVPKWRWLRKSELNLVMRTIEKKTQQTHTEVSTFHIGLTAEISDV